MNSVEKKYLNEVMNIRKLGLLTYRDVVVLIAAMCDLSFTEFKKIIRMKIVNTTGIDKSDVSKSLIKLKELNVIIEDSLGLFRLNSEL